MEKAKINYKGNGYEVIYTTNRYLFGHNEKVEHILRFRKHQFKGKSLDDVINKFKKFLEEK